MVKVAINHTRKVMPTTIYVLFIRIWPSIPNKKDNKGKINKAIKNSIKFTLC